MDLENGPELGKYADIFDANTRDLASSVSDIEAQSAIEALQTEMFKALRLLEIDVYRIVHDKKKD